MTDITKTTDSSIKIENKHYKKIIDTVNLFDVADDYMNNTDNDEIAQKWFIPSVIKEFGVNSSDELMKELEYDKIYSEKEVDRNIKILTGLIVKELYFYNMEDLLNFILLHSGVDEDDVVKVFLENMVETQSFSETLGFLELENFLSKNKLLNIKLFIHLENKKEHTFNMEDLNNKLNTKFSAKKLDKALGMNQNEDKIETIPKTKKKPSKKTNEHVLMNEIHVKNRLNKRLRESGTELGSFEWDETFDIIIEINNDNSKIIENFLTKIETFEIGSSAKDMIIDIINDFRNDFLKLNKVSSKPTKSPKQ